MAVIALGTDDVIAPLFHSVAMISISRYVDLLLVDADVLRDWPVCSSTVKRYSCLPDCCLRPLSSSFFVVTGRRIYFSLDQGARRALLASAF